MSDNLITAKEALKILHLESPVYIGYLVQRHLLPRVTIGPRKYRYYIEDCEHLLELVKSKGICLTSKPNYNH